MPHFRHSPRASGAPGAGFVLLVSILSAGPAEAQAPPAPPARPDYQVLRYNENWSVLRTLPKTDVFDPIKFIPLNESGSAYVSFGGQLRLRGESVSDFNLTDLPENEGSFGLLRALV